MAQSFRVGQWWITCSAASNCHKAIIKDAPAAQTVCYRSDCGKAGTFPCASTDPSRPAKTSQMLGGRVGEGGTVWERAEQCGNGWGRRELVCERWSDAAEAANLSHLPRPESMAWGHQGPPPSVAGLLREDTTTPQLPPPCRAQFYPFWYCSTDGGGEEV